VVVRPARLKDAAAPRNSSGSRRHLLRARGAKVNSSEVTLPEAAPLRYKQSIPDAGGGKPMPCRNASATSIPCSTVGRHARIPLVADAASVEDAVGLSRHT
jgi:hypothetical protein